MQNALRNAELGPADIDYINAHGTSTPLGDVAECIAGQARVRRARAQARDLSTKSMTGHLLGAAAGIEAVFTALAIRDQVAPPTANLVDIDPQCDLDFVPRVARPMRIRAAISNSFGFGGTNATIAFREVDA
jgi:3-oxoacyl-[acyl-carrier-protein] synthase II